jgi:hypothetical protein
MQTFVSMDNVCLKRVFPFIVDTFLCELYFIFERRFLLHSLQCEFYKYDNELVKHTIQYNFC